MFLFRSQLHGGAAADGFPVQKGACLRLRGFAPAPHQRAVARFTMAVWSLKFGSARVGSPMPARNSPLRLHAL